MCAADNVWEQLQGKGDAPGSLQEHTMVGYRDTLYVFGGEVGFSNGIETPLWMYNIKVSKSPGYVRERERAPSIHVADTGLRKSRSGKVS